MARRRRIRNKNRSARTFRKKANRTKGANMRAPLPRGGIRL